MGPSNIIQNFSKLVVITKEAFKNKETLTAQKLLRSLNTKDKEIITTLQDFGIIERVIDQNQQLKYKISSLDKTIEALEKNLEKLQKNLNELTFQKNESIKLINYLKAK